MDRRGAAVCGRCWVFFFTSEATDSLGRKTGDQSGSGRGGTEANGGQTSSCQNRTKRNNETAQRKQPGSRRGLSGCHEVHSAEEEAPAKSETGGVVKGILQSST